ncbi:MAG: Eco29kI family restriction endonuclease [Opitutales bacterium]|nr:Eco29kI family restriction endonuclease [Opitutales bacterium]
MSGSDQPHPSFQGIERQIKELNRLLSRTVREKHAETNRTSPAVQKAVSSAGELVEALRSFRETFSAVSIGSLGITLGRSDSIARFFAFSFCNQEMRPLVELETCPFYGSGVYAVYFVGGGMPVYQPLSGSETPLYVGKADPKNPQAESTEEQGVALYSRLREHAKNIAKTDLRLEDFRYRASPIQSGMQMAVEDFMIRLFRPIWNKQTKICFGLGKHGDRATTRANKRSPWDTLHPGRHWAADTTEDQMLRTDIEAKIRHHLREHPPFADKATLFRHLSLI